MWDGARVPFPSAWHSKGNLQRPTGGGSERRTACRVHDMTKPEPGEAAEAHTDLDIDLEGSSGLHRLSGRLHTMQRCRERRVAAGRRWRRRAGLHGRLLVGGDGQPCPCLARARDVNGRGAATANGERGGPGTLGSWDPGTLEPWGRARVEGGRRWKDGLCYGCMDVDVSIMMDVWT